jgi:hypothetical protein
MLHDAPLFVDLSTVEAFPKTYKEPLGVKTTDLRSLPVGFEFWNSQSEACENTEIVKAQNKKKEKNFVI